MKIGFVAMLAAAVITGCGGGSATPSTHVLTGTLTLNAPTEGPGQVCWGSGGYGDIGAGTVVEVRDESGKILGTGPLGAGQRVSRECVFDFKVSNLPDANFYQVEVSRRGEITYSQKDLSDKGWSVSLSLG